MLLLQLLPVLLVVGAIAVAYVRTTTETRRSIRDRINARLEARQEAAAPAAKALPEVATVAALRERTVDAEFARAREADAPTEADLIAEEVERLLAAKLDASTVLRVDHALRHAADDGKREAEVLRFPAELLTDRGRAANNYAPETIATLRGLPLKLDAYLRARGFGVWAYVVGYRTNGVPGDVALIARWA